MGLNNLVKRLQDIMRNDAGINGDAQRIEQMVWILFLKVYDAKEEVWEFYNEKYTSIIPEELRWRNWAVDHKGGKALSELIQIKVEHVRLGHLDLYSKGGKLRRIYIPKSLQDEALSWLDEKQQESGFIFLNRFGKRITTRGISGQLKKLAERYDIDTAVVYPHSFRHRFAKNFLEKCNDIAFLADLMGHESIETTRIYLRKTATEQREIVDMVIDW